MSDETASPIHDDLLPYAPPAAPPPAVSFRPLSAWAVLGYTLLIFFLYSSVQVVAGLAFFGTQMVVGLVAGRTPSLAMDPGSIGLLLGAGTLLAVPLGIWMTFFCVRKRIGAPVAEYLGFRWPTWRQAAFWAAALFAATTAYDLLGSWLDRPEIPDFMRDLLTGLDSPVTIVVLWLAVILAAPCFEEILFRGFLVEGLRRSRIGQIGTVVVSSLLFASIHLQYDLFDMGAVLALGMLLAAARLQTGSTYLVIALHAFHNGVSMVWTTWALRGGG